MAYRCVTTTVGGFVQQLAVSYLRNGYWFYVPGCVPDGKDPAAIDRKLIERYEIDLSKWARARRKRLGVAGVQYLRFERFFLLLATHGRHRFFEEEANVLRDARRHPITFAGYSISHRGGKPRVRIERFEFQLLLAHFLELAVHRSADAIEAELLGLPFEPYEGVRRQLLYVLEAVNRRRRTAGYAPVPVTAIRLRRRTYRPFDPGQPLAGWSALRAGDPG